MRHKPVLPSRELTDKELDNLKIGGTYVSALGYRVHLVAKPCDGDLRIWVTKEWGKHGWVYKATPGYLIKFILRKRAKGAK